MNPNYNENSREVHEPNSETRQTQKEAIFSLIESQNNISAYHVRRYLKISAQATAGRLNDLKREGKIFVSGKIRVYNGKRNVAYDTYSVRTDDDPLYVRKKTEAEIKASKFDDIMFELKALSSSRVYFISTDSLLEIINRYE